MDDFIVPARIEKLDSEPIIVEFVVIQIRRDGPFVATNNAPAYMQIEWVCPSVVRD